jgi:hypothetical protein
MALLREGVNCLICWLTHLETVFGMRLAARNDFTLNFLASFECQGTPGCALASRFL